MVTAPEVTLAQAAIRIRRGYFVARDLVLRGDLCGRQDARGRWWVSTASIEAYSAREKQEPIPAHAA